MIGVVVIGRNEGERLRRCLESVRHGAARVVYVDSGSTDGSVEMAKGLGLDVVDLDMTQSFTAARARNEGTRRLQQLDPNLQFVQYVDGDCEIVDGYLALAAEALGASPELAAVAGRLRERCPENSIYNRLCDMEWNTSVGEVGAVGGVSMFRISDFEAVEGFDPTLIAGEEPELCVRLRLIDRKIRRIDAEMGWHDAAMTRFGQWWRRATRGGHAALEGAAMHGFGPTRHKIADVRRTLIWGAVLPVAAIVMLSVAVFAWPWAALGVLAIAGLYGLWAIRMVRRYRISGVDSRTALIATWFAFLGRFASLVGFSRYLWYRMTRRRPKLIEYKDPTVDESCGDSDSDGSHAADAMRR